MSQEEKNAMDSADKRKVSLESAIDEPIAKKPAIAGLLDPSLTCRFLDDPVLGNMCNRLAENQRLVQTARQLLKALEDARFENGTLNDDALKHFGLVLQAWRNQHFRSEICGTIHEQECVLPLIIEELSSRVEDEQIEHRMLRIKGDQNLEHILGVAEPAATMMRGLLIILIGYWSYKKLPLKLGEENGCDVNHVEKEKVVRESDDDFNKRVKELEEHDIWLMKGASPIQRLEGEGSLMDLADDIKGIPRLVNMADRCVAFLKSFDPRDNGTLIYAKEHFELVHKVLEDPDFIHLLFERIKRDSYVNRVVHDYANRDRLQNADAVAAVVSNITKDPGFHLYEERNEKKEVGGALRIFLSILIVYWIDKDAYAKVRKKLNDYFQARAAADAAAKIARGGDNIKALINYSTRFAGDLKGLKATLDELYGGRPHGHIFYELKIAQFEHEIMSRETHYDVEMDVMARLSNGTCMFAFRNFRLH